MQLPTPDRFGTKMKQGWNRLLGVARPRSRFARRWRRHRYVAGPQPPAPPSSAVDPVALTILAVSRLGPATLRTVANGRPLSVTVPDEQVGAIFRAALNEMQKTRTTDRLIDIVIAGGTPDAQRASTGA
ncbi:MAG TPA: hypothetical protein VGU20_04585 [Stellaceae bacterium]|nr:hypothetical protein [Stellaceae bacterium]